MWPDQVSNPVPLAHESDMLRDPARIIEIKQTCLKCCYFEDARR